MLPANAFLIRLALAAGHDRLAARAELLDRINVFPVADSDTGTNLRAALAPLGNVATPAADCIELLQRTAVGNSGNIAAAFFPSLVAAENGTALAAAFAEGERLARRAVLQPKDGTMLDVFQTLAVCSKNNALPPAPELLSALAECVRKTANILPELRDAGVVDAGALGMFLFFEGFFAALANDTALVRPVGERFAGLLSPRFAERGERGERGDDAGHCVQVSIHVSPGADIAPEVLAASLDGQADSVVTRQTGDTLHLHLHLHSDNPDALKARLARFGEIGGWQSEAITDAPTAQADDAPAPKPTPFRLLCDAAASLPRALARREGITLLDSSVLCGGVAKPETLWDQATVYSALRAGEKAATAQASIRERHEHFAAALETPGPCLYLAVGSAYTGNVDAARAWQAEHDPEGRFLVLDSGAASGRLAVIALMTARAARSGVSPADLPAHIQDICREAVEYVCIDDLKYLARGGRISKVAGFAGNLLGMRPVISPMPEGVRKLTVARTRAAQRDFVLARMRERAESGPPALVLLQYSDNEDWARQDILPELERIFPESEMLVVPLSLTSGVHMGPGTWAVAACPEILP